MTEPSTDSPVLQTPLLQTPLLQTQNIGKSFGPIVANDSIDFQVQASQIHALLGENGAGKSTLMKIICGLQQPDTGSIYWKGRQCIINSPKVARSMGIGMVHQHFALFEGLSVCENIAFSIDGAVQGKSLEHKILELAERYGLMVEPKRPVFELSAGERQRIEILRALLLNPELLILDEPTSVLTPQEADQLFNTVRKLAASGHGIVFISHKLKEVKALCDTATVLRAGQVVGLFEPREQSTESMAELMLGSRNISTEKRWRVAGENRLQVSNLELTDNDVTVQIDKLNVSAGEIFGVAGVAGNGQELLYAALSGEITSNSDASVILNGQHTGRLGPNERRATGAMFIPEERLGHAAVPQLSLTENTLLTNVTNPEATHKGFVNRRHLVNMAERITKQFDVRHAGVKHAARNLSGGNLQKFVVGREIVKKPSVLVINQPTWGVDAVSAMKIREALLNLADTGSAIVVISQDLEELLEISDKLAVLHRGKLSQARAVHDWNVEQLGLAMTGSGEAA